jgi:hypothetical protein
MITLIIIALLLEYIYSPRLEWIDASKMLIVHYNFENSRRYLILWK